MSISRRSFLQGAVAAAVAGPAAITTAEWPLTLGGVPIVFDDAVTLSFVTLDAAMRENLYGDRSHRD